MISFDHIAISGETLAEARSHAEQALGVFLQSGGEHDVFFTHNALLGLQDGLYLEVIAINPDAPTPDRARWFDLDRFKGSPRLTNWICRSDDLRKTLSTMPAGMGAPVDLQRGNLRWSMAVPEDGILPFDNVGPALMQWHVEQHPAATLAPSGVRLTRLTVRHPQADALRSTLEGEIEDDRIALEVGDRSLHAAFETPHGPRAIEG